MHRFLTAFSMVIAFVLGTLVEPALSSRRPELDGAWWKSLPTNCKLYTVEGVDAGYQTGYTDGKFASALFVYAHRNDTISKFSKQIIFLPQRTYDQPYENYFKIIDGFYGGTSVSNKIPIGMVFTCLSKEATSNCLDDLKKLKAPY